MFLKVSLLTLFIIGKNNKIVLRLVDQYNSEFDSIVYENLKHHVFINAAIYL